MPSVTHNPSLNHDEHHHQSCRHPNSYATSSEPPPLPPLSEAHSCMRFMITQGHAGSIHTTQPLNYQLVCSKRGTNFPATLSSKKSHCLITLRKYTSSDSSTPADTHVLENISFLALLTCTGTQRHSLPAVSRLTHYGHALLPHLWFLSTVMLTSCNSHHSEHVQCHITHMHIDVDMCVCVFGV